MEESHQVFAAGKLKSRLSEKVIPNLVSYPGSPRPNKEWLLGWSMQRIPDPTNGQSLVFGLPWSSHIQCYLGRDLEWRGMMHEEKLLYSIAEYSAFGSNTLS